MYVSSHQMSALNEFAAGLITAYLAMKLSRLPLCSLLTGSLSRLLYDEKKIHLVYPEEMDSNVRDYSYDFAFQVIQEAF